MAKRDYYEILGMRVPHIELFVRPGRDIARLVEVAALTQALKKMGHDPAKTFNDRLIRFMSEQANQPAPTKIKPTAKGGERCNAKANRAAIDGITMNCVSTPITTGRGRCPTRTKS